MKSARQTTLRIGYGYDVHRFGPSGKFILGGVEIPHTLGLIGHSDADVLLHSVMDALLGASALGDIGKHFPNADPRYKDISSLILLGHVRDLLSRHRFQISNIDSTVVLDAPMISPYVDEMRTNIAGTLDVDSSRVSVKATTSEGLGFIGSGDGAAAHAVACLIQR